MRRTAAALLLFAAACSHDVATTAPTPAQPAHRPLATAAAAPRFALVDPLALRGGASAGRSVFAYREEVARSRGREVAVVTPAQQPSTPVTQQPSDATPRPRDLAPGPFPYRAIGRLGPDGQQLVAFVIDGEVKLARAGEVLADRYLVRTVGIESVEVALLSAPEVRWTLELGK